MARLGASKKKKSPRVADPRQLKKELKRVTEQLESVSENLPKLQNSRWPRAKSCA